jgi:hypothetical protein
MSQASLFGPDSAPDIKQPHDQPVRMRVLVTVKAAPNPSATYGETVCAAALRLDLDSPGWVRLYPDQLPGSRLGGEVQEVRHRLHHRAAEPD